MSEEEATKGNENQRTNRGRGSRNRSGAKPKVTGDKSSSSSSIGKVPQSKRETQTSRSKTQHTKETDVKASVSHILQLKGKRPIVGLTAYDAIMGRAVAESGVDFLLVGDSVGTTFLGYETTIPVTINDMVRHTAAVRRSKPGCLLVADLPFGEASLSFDRLLESSRRLIRKAVRMRSSLKEGRMLPTILKNSLPRVFPFSVTSGYCPKRSRR